MANIQMSLKEFYLDQLVNELRFADEYEDVEKFYTGFCVQHYEEYKEEYTIAEFCKEVLSYHDEYMLEFAIKVVVLKYKQLLDEKIEKNKLKGNDDKNYSDVIDLYCHMYLEDVKKDFKEEEVYQRIVNEIRKFNEILLDIDVKE